MDSRLARMWCALHTHKAKTTWVMVASLLAGHACAAQPKCEVFAPLAVVKAQPRYSDKAGSVVDEASVATSEAEVKPLRDFVTYLVKAHDVGNSGCARSNLLAWASANALLAEPVNFAGGRERLRFTTAIDLAVLRMGTGFRDARVLGWLRELNMRIADDFGRRKQHDNLGVWSAVAAATANVLVGDPRLQEYADGVWREALGAIRFDGTVPTELKRESRSLLYHAYYLSALLLLQSAREAAGSPATPQERTRLLRLYQLVASGSCDIGAFTAHARTSLKQERPRDSDVATIKAFAPDFPASAPLCSRASADHFDPLLGGTIRATKEAFTARTR